MDKDQYEDEYKSLNRKATLKLGKEKALILWGETYDPTQGMDYFTEDRLERFRQKVKDLDGK